MGKYRTCDRPTGEVCAVCDRQLRLSRLIASANAPTAEVYKPGEGWVLLDMTRFEPIRLPKG